MCDCNETHSLPPLLEKADKRGKASTAGMERIKFHGNQAQLLHMWKNDFFFSLSNHHRRCAGKYGRLGCAFPQSVSGGSTRKTAKLFRGVYKCRRAIWLGCIFHASNIFSVLRAPPRSSHAILVQLPIRLQLTQTSIRARRAHTNERVNGPELSCSLPLVNIVLAVPHWKRLSKI